MRTFYALLFGATLAASLMICSPASAARATSIGASGDVADSDGSDLRLSDTHKELRHLSRHLRLNKDQRAEVSVILEERTREIRLLFDMESLSQENRSRLVTRVVGDSDARIETLLQGKQKVKFNKDLEKAR
jgi:hypothetical protein